MKEHSSKDLDNQETPACVFTLPDFKSLFTYHQNNLLADESYFQYAKYI